jgi:hypothetical protein
VYELEAAPVEATAVPIVAPAPAPAGPRVSPRRKRRR